MIQRIQSLFILLLIVAQAFFIFSPVAEISLNDASQVFMYIRGFKDVNGQILAPTAALSILAWAVFVLGMLTFFFYKKRILQIRFCIYNMLLNVGLIGFLAFQISGFVKANQAADYAYTLATIIPVINIILLFLAFRGIRKDELLVKAYERLR